MANHRAPLEVVNGYEVDTLARALYDVRSERRTPTSDEEWERHAIQFPQTHRILMDQAREEAVNYE